MIIKFILKFILWILHLVLSPIFAIFSPIASTAITIEYYSKLLDIVKSGWSFVFFIFGDTTDIFLNVIILFLTLKYIVLPIISAIRSIVLRGD